MIQKKTASIEEFNNSIGILNDDIETAINRYIKRGHINVAVVVGLLEGQKRKALDFMKNIKLQENNINFQKIKTKVDYIG